MASEKALTNRIIRWIDGLSDGKALKVRGDEHMERGTPDILASIGGRFVAIEVKHPSGGGRLSRIQQVRLGQWAAAGAVAFVATSLDDVKNRVLTFDSQDNSG